MSTHVDAGLVRLPRPADEVGEAVPGEVRLAYGLVAVGAACFVTGLVLQVAGWLGDWDGGPGPTLRLWPLTMVGLVLGGQLLTQAPRTPAGWLLLGMGVLSGVSVALTSLPASAADWSRWAPAAELVASALVPTLLLLLLFPDGRVFTRRWRPAIGATVALGVASAACGAAELIGQAVENRALSRGDLTGWTSWESYRHATGLAQNVVGGLLLAGVLGAIPYLVGRARQAEGRIRHGLLLAVLSWPAAQLAVLVAGGLFPERLAFLWGDLSWILVAGVMWLILPDLLNVGVLLHRSLLYGLLTVLVFPWYFGLGPLILTCAAGFAPLSSGVCHYVTTVAQNLALPPTGALRTTVSIVVAAVTTASWPLHCLWRYWLDRCDRRTPDLARADLAALLTDAVVPSEVLAGVVTSIAATLRVPYAALYWLDEPQPAATYGDQVNGWPTTTVALRQHREPIGTLLVGARSPDEGFTRRDLRVLRGLADQAGPALEAVRLTRNLQQARERLVLGREDERRRISRDLHDGLGPTLAGITLQLGAARTLVGSARSGQGVALLETLENELVQCTADVRRLVRGLRPTGLDELGLLATLQRQIAPLAEGSGVAVTVHADPAALTGLSAAVEVAALRIALEGVTNTVRHASAQTCQVTLDRRDSWLEIEVDDDGRGVQPGDEPGVGTLAMRERAAELGGVCTVEQNREVGTRVHARLPLLDREFDRGGFDRGERAVGG